MRSRPSRDQRRLQPASPSLDFSSDSDSLLGVHRVRLLDRTDAIEDSLAVNVTIPAPKPVAMTFPPAIRKRSGGRICLTSSRPYPERCSDHRRIRRVDLRQRRRPGAAAIQEPRRQLRVLHQELGRVLHRLVQSRYQGLHLDLFRGHDTGGAECMQPRLELRKLPARDEAEPWIC